MACRVWRPSACTGRPINLMIVHLFVDCKVALRTGIQNAPRVVERGPRDFQKTAALQTPRRRTTRLGWSPPVRRQLASQRVGPNLEVHHLALRTLAAFDVPEEVRAVLRPQAAALPPAVRIIDAAIESP